VSFAILLSALIFSPNYKELPITWKSKFTVSHDTHIISDIKINSKKRVRLEKIIGDITHHFFSDYETSLPCSDRNDLQIVIIDRNILTDNRYFIAAKPTNFGRYFYSTNTIYIVHELFRHPEWLAHEMAHYFFKECGVLFDSAEEEHEYVYDYQNLFKNRLRK